MPVPGPVTVVDSTYDEVYGDEEALALDVAVALNSELLELQAAGCDILQIDEPAMTRYHEKVADYGASALDRGLEGITVPTIIHLCYGYPLAGASQYEYEDPDALLLEVRDAGSMGSWSSCPDLPAQRAPLGRTSTGTAWMELTPTPRKFHSAWDGWVLPLASVARTLRM